MSQETQAIQTVLNLSKTAIDAIASLINVPLNVVEELITLGSEAATYNMLSNTDAVETRICQEFALNDFKRELIAQDIPFVNVLDENGQYLIITKKEDSERVSALADHLAATKSRKIEFTEKEFNRMFARIILLTTLRESLSPLITCLQNRLHCLNKRLTKKVSL